MTTPSAVLAATFAATFALSASAAELRWAGTTDPQTMDPHAVNAAPVLGFLNNVYEGLVRRGPDMSVEGALAERWEPLGGDGWRFHLRRGVTFHDGADFTAEDVLFSYERAASPEADTASWFAPISEVRIVDDFTIDFLTRAPNPIFPDSIANFMIMDRGWAEANGAVRPSKDEENFARGHANGTGAFRLVERQPGLRTVLEPFDDWWGERRHNIDRATFTPIQNAATAVAALISGEVDVVNPVPIQDVERLKTRDDLKIIEGTEARVIMLGLAQGSDGEPLFADPRLRRAVAHAVDIDAILKVIMRGAPSPASQLVSPEMRGYSDARAARPAYDPDQARALVAEAGYEAGPSFDFKCPNDRYLNDEAVCQAVTAMLAKVGLDARLEAMPVRNYWPELRAGRFDMYLLGWSPGTFDHEHPIRFLAATPNEEKKLGSWNFGGYSNARVDELLPAIQSEIDEGARQAMLDEVAEILQEETAYVPLYVQPLLWGARSNVDLVQRPDDFFILRWTRVN